MSNRWLLSSPNRFFKNFLWFMLFYVQFLLHWYGNYVYFAERNLVLRTSSAIQISDEKNSLHGSVKIERWLDQCPCEEIKPCRKLEANVRVRRELAFLSALTFTLSLLKGKVTARGSQCDGVTGTQMAPRPHGRNCLSLTRTFLWPNDVFVFTP